MIFFEQMNVYTICVIKLCIFIISLFFWSVQYTLFIFVSTFADHRISKQGEVASTMLELCAFYNTTLSIVSYYQYSMYVKAYNLFFDSLNSYITYDSLTK